MSRLGEIPDLAPSSLGYDEVSSASSGRKRKRDGSPTQNTAFTAAAKNLVKSRTNADICWNCDVRFVEFCHVIGQRDPVVRGMGKKGMITFDHLGDYRNAILLCPNCHGTFDRTSYMGWVFLPTKLQYFVDWEKKDFAHRQAVLEQDGRKISRSFPDEQDYEKYMRETKTLLDPDDGLCRGGLYNRYILDEEVFAPAMIEAYQRRGLKTIPGLHPEGPKRWHGAPMAAINRGFLVTGAPWRRLPRQEWNILRELQDLYSQEPSIPVSSESDTSDRMIGVQLPQAEREGEITQAPAAAPQQTSTTSTTMATNPAQTELPGEQQQHDTRSEALSIKNEFDSAIDVTSRYGVKVKPGYNNSRGVDQANNALDAIIRAGFRKRQNRRARESMTEKELGVSALTWCFGPSSTTFDKINKHVGKRRRINT